MDSWEIASRTWVKAVENAKRLHTAFTHFPHLPTTIANVMNLKIEVFNKSRYALPVEKHTISTIQLDDLGCGVPPQKMSLSRRLSRSVAIRERSERAERVRGDAKHRQRCLISTKGANLRERSEAKRVHTETPLGHCDSFRGCAPETP